MSLILRRRPHLPRHTDLICENGNTRYLKPKNFIGRYNCEDKMKVFCVQQKWEGRFPNPYTSCGTGDRQKNTRCTVRAPGAAHPGVVMITDRTYWLEMDLLDN